MRRTNTNNDHLDTRVITTGLNNLDAVLGGFHGGELILLGSRPAMGKTTLALNIVNHMAIGKGCPCLYITMENTKKQLERKLSIIGEDGTLETLHHMDGKSNHHIYIVDEYISNATSTELFDMVRKYKEEYDIQFVVMDYLQLFVHGMSEEEFLMNKLKTQALELNIPIMLLSQLGQGMEYRNGRIPKLKDFENRDYLGAVPDVLMVLTRDGYYDSETSANASCDAEITVLKSPCDVTGSVKASWLSDRLCFIDREDKTIGTNQDINCRNQSAELVLACAILGKKTHIVEMSVSNNSKYDQEKKKQIYTVINEILDYLTDRERSVLISLFGLNGEKMTYAELAQRQGVTEEEIRDIEVFAIRKLRHPRRTARLKNIIP